MRYCQRNHMVPDGRRKCLTCQNDHVYRRRIREDKGTYELTPDWYDWVAVERALKGQEVGRKLTRRERFEYLERSKEL